MDLVDHVRIARLVVDDRSFAVVNGSVSGVSTSFPPGKVNCPCPILAARSVKVVGSVES